MRHSAVAFQALRASVQDLALHLIYPAQHCGSRSDVGLDK